MTINMPYRQQVPLLYVSSKRDASPKTNGSSAKREGCADGSDCRQASPVHEPLRGKCGRTAEKMHQSHKLPTYEDEGGQSSQQLRKRDREHLDRFGPRCVLYGNPETLLRLSIANVRKRPNVTTNEHRRWTTSMAYAIKVRR